jgi:hypothetical protein
VGELEGRAKIARSYIVLSIAPIEGIIVTLAPTVSSIILLPARFPKVKRIVPATALFVTVSPVKTTRVLVVGVQIASVVVESKSV